MSDSNKPISDQYHTEIERKFLVKGQPKSQPWLGKASVLIRQAYLMRSDNKILRIRQKGEHFYLTLKIGSGMTRFEFEQQIDDIQGEALLNHHALEPPLQKIRFYIPIKQHTWEVDVFWAENTGLVIAEIELNHEDEDFDRPDWLGEEVTDDPRYQNHALVQNPYKNWNDKS